MAEPKRRVVIELTFLAPAAVTAGAVLARVEAMIAAAGGEQGLYSDGTPCSYGGVFALERIQVDSRRIEPEVPPLEAAAEPGGGGELC